MSKKRQHISNLKHKNDRLHNQDRNQRVQVAKDSYGFELRSVVTRLAAIVFVWAGLRLATLQGGYRQTKILSNYIGLYDSTIEVWNSHASLYSGLLSLMLEGGSSQVLEADAEQVVKDKLDRLSRLLIPRLSSFKDKDLGEFQQYYADITSSLLLCDRVKSKKLQYYDSCG